MIEHCPVCALQLHRGDVCATDIELGTCHATCLEGSPIVNLDTGDPSDGSISTFPYSPAPVLGARRGDAISKITPFAIAYPAPWRLGDREVVDRDGCNVEDFDDTPEDREFWRGVVEAVNAVAGVERRFPSPYSTEAGRRGGLGRDDLGDPINLQGSGPVPIEPREG